jgi:hypothetical protein
MTVLRDLSLILLAIEVFVVALIPLVLLGAAVYGLFRLRRHGNLPSWLHLIQAYVNLGLSYVELAMATAVRPIFWVNKVISTVRGWLVTIAKTGDMS